MFDYLAGDRRKLRRGTRAYAREVELDDIRVFVDHGFQWDGSTNVWLTRARASFAVTAGPVFDVRPRTTLARLIGYQGGVSCGDPCFDYFFAVRTPDPDETWRALTTRARSLLAREFEDARLVSDGRMVTLWREGDFGREVDAAVAIEIVHEIARHRSEALDPLRRLPGAVYRPASGPWDARLGPAVELTARVPVRIGPVVHDGRAVTAVSAPCGRALPSFSVVFDAEPVLAGGGLPERLVEAAFEVGASTLSCDGNRIELRWPDLVTSRALLVRAGELVGRVAGDPLGGLYR
jgi:hypothetical protein